MAFGQSYCLVSAEAPSCRRRSGRLQNYAPGLSEKAQADLDLIASLTQQVAGGHAMRVHR